MGRILIIHNPRCGKSRNALNYLIEKNIEFEIRDYLKDNLSKEELKKILSKLNLNVKYIIRKKEDIYRDLIKTTPNPTEDELLNWIIKNQKLLERPIIIKGDSAVIGRPTENINKLFD